MALDAYDPAVHDISRLRVWGCGGSPVPAAMVERVATQWPNCHLLSLYGRSETQVATMCTLDDDPARSADSDGRPLPGIEVAILDAHGAELPPDQEGEIAQRGPTVMLGYFGDPESTAAVFTDEGWCRSGDLGRLNSEGYLRVTGRVQDIIIRGGSNISVREVEDHLRAHPSVKDVAIVAMPDRVLGERACAWVVPAGEAPTLGDLTDFLRNERRIAVWKLPERLEITDVIPMTPTGKVQKFVLREELSKRLEDEQQAGSGAPT
jgi:acyl-CoA synthetase (AMP-forming)/AMP-acid ligase II